MREIAVKIKRVGWGAALPKYQTDGAAGADVFCNENGYVEPGEHRVVSTGLSMEVPEGYECQIRPRSGLAAKFGVTIMNSPGTIDSDYRGEVKLIIFNSGPDPFGYRVGERLAQFVFAPVTRAIFKEAEELEETQRGVGGLGSTGV
jgi:dUTP diphosphatase